MVNAMIGLVASLSLGMVTPTMDNGNVDDDPVADEAGRIVSSFLVAYKKCGQNPAFVPKVLVETEPTLISYDPQDPTVRVSRYTELPEELQGLMAAWGAAAGMPDGKSLFGDVFNSLLVPHEMGHWIQHVSNRYDALDNWEAELEANRMAVAYWSLDKDSAKDLPRRFEAFVGFLGQLPDPVPEGQDPRAYFNANYGSFNAEQYGWFQGALMREAWARRDEAGFCDLATVNAATPLDAFEKP